MPTFEIPDGPTSIEAPRAGDPQTPRPAVGAAVYSVTNTASDSVVGRLGVKIAGSSKAEWFTIEGDRERTFDPGETQTVTIRVSFPPDVPAGDYPFRLRAVAVNDPDNDHAEGPMTTAKLGGAGVVAGKKSLLWLWILIGVVVVVIIAAALFFMLRSNKPEAPTGKGTPATSSPPAVAIPEKRSRLPVGGTLEGVRGDALVSSNGYFRAVMQGDCNFVVYHDPRALWASGTQGRGSACTAIMQGDGNLVVYTQDKVPVWASGTQGNPGADVVMQDDGNLVVYVAGRALWASNTVVR